MEYRQLGESNVKVSVVTLGAWAIGGWLWGGTDDAGVRLTDEDTRLINDRLDALRLEP